MTSPKPSRPAPAGKDRPRNRSLTATPSRFPLSLVFLSLFFFLLPLLGGYMEELRPGALRVLLLAAAGMRVYEGRQPGGVPWKPNPGWPVVLLIAWPVLTSLTGADATNSLHALSFLGTGILAYLLVADAASGERGRNVLFASALAGAAVTGLWAVLEYRRTVVYLHDPSWRVFATFMGPNLLANYLLTALFLGLSGVLLARRPWAPAAGMGTLLCAAGLVLTGSRGAVVYSLPVGFVVWAVLSHLARDRDNPEGVRAQRLRLGAILAVGLLMGAYFMKPTAVRVSNAAAPASEEASSSQFRLLTWKGTLGMIRDRPLLGWGPGLWEEVYPRYARAGYTKAAHNMYLQAAAETGIPGLLLGLAVLAYGLGGRKRGDMAEAGRTAALAATMLHNGVDYGWLLFAPAMLTWGLIGARPKNGPMPGGPDSRSADTGREAAWKSIPGRYGGAVAGAAALLTLLGLPPAYAELKGMEADTARQAKNFIEAKNEYAAAARIDPTSSEWPRMAGRVLMYDMHDPGAAVPYFEEAVRRDPLRGTVRHSLAVAYTGTGETEKALKTFGEALRLEPNGVRILMDAANLHEGLSERELLRGDKEAALDHKRKALNLYRKVTQVEESPVNRVKALAEMQDASYAIAHQRLAKNALLRGDRAEAAREIPAGIRSADEYLKGLDRWREVMKVQGRFNPREEAAVRDARAEMEEWKAKLQALDKSRK